MSVKAVIFDLYGVLGLNGWQSFKQVHFGDRPDEWGRLSVLGQRVDAGKASEQDLVAAVAQATGATEETIRYQFEHTVPNEPLLTFIQEELKPHYQVGLLSNASRDVLGHIFSVEQQALFDVAISSFHVGLTKPNPDMFLLVCDRLDVRPDQCVYVDDQRRHLDAAANLGFHTVSYESVAQVTQAIRGALSE